MLVAQGLAASAQTLPTGGTIAAGGATISQPSASTLNINQTSSRAIVNWQSFSVGQGGTVNFNQPNASAATLNRVTGTTASSIAGQINAPGTVLLVNPNGIAITPTGTVNVGSFAASTLDIKNEDFLAGRYKFTGNGSSATVVNGGRINVSDGGFAALLGGRVANDGVISARLGRVGLASGERITLDLSGDGFLSVEVPSSQLGNITDSTGTALVSNKGKIRANGGTVYLSAATASNILRDAVNVPGSIRANSVGTRNGRIVIGGGAGGRVNVSGRLSASGAGGRHRSIAAKGKGGQIDISGNQIALNGARLNVSGATGGGTIRIGGDAQGRGEFPHAQSVSIDSATVIRADATETGNGGTVVVWSDGHMAATGTFSARGGAISGDGGLIETSGHTVDFTGIRVNASATSGRAGEWLIDPVNLTIDSAAAATIASALNTGSNVTLLTTATTASGPGVQAAGAGDIVVNAAISWASAARLSLNAYNSIAINAAVTGQSGTLALSANGTATQTAPISVASLALDFTGSYTLNHAANSVRLLSNTTGGGCCGGPIQLTTLGDLRVTNVRAYGLTLNVGGALNVTDTGILVPNNSQFIANVSGNVTFAGGENFFGFNTRVTAGGSITFNGATRTWYGALFTADRDITVNSLVTNNAGGTLTLRAFGGGINLNNDIAWSTGRLEMTALRNIVFNAPNFGSANSGTGQIVASAAGDVRFNQAANIGTGSIISAGGLIASEAGAPLTMRGGATFNSASDIYLNASLTNTGGGLLTLNADANGSGSGSVYTAPISISSDGDVNIFYHPTSYSDPSFYPVVTGGGTLRAYKLVSTVDQFRQLDNVTGSNLLFALNRDIDFSGVTTTTSNQTPMQPLTLAESNLIETFNGTLDGFNHALLNVTMNTWNAPAAMIQNNNGTIRNLGIVGGSFFSQNVDAASLVLNNNGTLTNVFSTASVGATRSAGGLVLTNNGTINGASYATGNVSGGDIVGGLVAVNYHDVTQAYASGSVSGRVAGGLVGLNAADGRIQYAYALGSVAGATYAGGLVGVNQWSAMGVGRNGYIGRGGGLISDTYAAGAVSGSVRGGLVGNNEFCDCGNDVNTFNSNHHSSATVLYSVWDSATTGVSSYAGRSYFTVNSSFSSEQVSMVEALSGHTFAAYRVFDHPTDSTFSFDNQGFNANWYMIPGVTRPFLRSEFSTTIQNTHQLQLMNMNSTATYTLARDINATRELASGIWLSQGGSSGFSPIAPVQYADQTRQHWNIDIYDYSGPEQNFTYVDQQSPTFVRTNNYIYHYGSGENVSVTETLVASQFESISLSATNFTGTLDGRGHTISGLSVLNTGGGAALFSQIGTGGTVRDLGISGGSFSGGNLAPAATLALVNFGTVSGVWASGSQVSGILQTGGLVGNNRGLITQSYTNVTTTGAGASSAVTGGLVGVNQGAITDSYAIGTTAGGGTVGGLVGFNLGSIANTYSTGVVQNLPSGDALLRAGALVGFQAGSGSIVNSYYNVSTATNPLAQNTLSVGTGLTTVQMQDINSYQSTYAGWDFRNVWAPPSSGYYPELYATSPIIVVNSSVTRQYGDSAAPLPLTVYGLRGWDSVNLALSSGATSTSDVGTYAISAAPLIIPAVVRSTAPVVAQIVGSYWGLQLLVNSTYVIWSQNASAAQVAAALSFAGIVGTVDASGYITLTSNGNITLGVPFVCCLYGPGQTYAHLTLGTYTARQLPAVSSHDGTDYRIINLPTNAVTVTPRPVTVTASDQSHAYGTNHSLGTSAFSASGLVNGQTINAVALASNGASATASVAGGPYAIVASNATGGGGFNPSNYAINYVNGTLTVTPALLTVTAGNRNTEYGLGTTFAGTEFTSSGLRNGDAIGSVTLASAGATTTAGVAGGPYAIVASNATGGTFDARNYTISYANGQLTVTPATLTIIATDASSVYGQGTIFAGTEFTSAGLRNSETIGSVTLASAGATTTAGVAGGPYAIVASNATGGTFDASNYTIGYVDGRLTVTRASLTVTANDGSSVYGQGTIFAGTEFTSTGLRNGETIGSVTLASVGATTTASVAGGPYAIVAGNATGGTFDPGNYAISYADGRLSVTRAPLTVTANDLSSVYGRGTTFAGTEFSSTGLRNGETIGAVALASVGASTTAGVAGGPYAIVASNATGGTFDAGNYAINYAGGWLTVTRAPLTVTANDLSNVYGQGTTFAGTEFTSTGLQNGETIGLVALTSNGSAPTASVARGPYAIVAGNAAGGTFDASNYTIGYVNGLLTVTPAPLVVTANGGTSVYGSSPTNPGLSATGLQNGESVAVLSGLTNSFGIGATTGVAGSPYTLNVAGALTNPNYRVASLNSAIWTVTPAPITVTANGGTSVYGSNPLNPGLTVTGLQNGQTVAALTGLTNSFGITGASHAGNTTLTVAGLLANPNYSVTVRNTGLWSVTPAPLTVTADPQSRLVGERDPVLTYRITTGQLFNGDLFTGVLSRTGNDLPGTYEIGQGTLTLSQDYALSFIGAAFDIRAVPSDPSSQFIPPFAGTVGFNPAAPTNQVTITFQNPVTTPPVTAPVTASPPADSVEPVDPAASATVRNSVTASLPRERQGLIFAPISQYDPAQYTGRTLPGFAPQAGEATVLVMIARALAREERDGIVVDSFWNSAGNNGAGATIATRLALNAAFSDGAGRFVSLDEANAFPLVAGTTDIAELLRTGPVIVAGALGSDGTQSWMLAIGLTADGLGVIANDAVSGRQVVLAYDPATRTLGAATGVVDARTGAVIPLADAEAIRLAGLNDFNPNGTTALQSFAAEGYFAVSLK